MAIILPLWITLGRGFFGSGGWTTLALLISVAPIMLCGLLFLAFFIRSRPRVRTDNAVSKIDAVLLTVLYLSIFLYGIFLVDGGDTPESINSLASLVLGDGFIAISGVVSSFLIGITFLFGALAVGAVLVQQFKVLRSKRALIVAVLVAVAMIVYFIVQANSPASQDQRTSRDFQLLSQDIINYKYANKDSLPGDLKAAIDRKSSYSSQESVANRINSYTYTLKNNDRFELCATFYTDTRSEETISQGPAKVYSHPKGYHCFAFSDEYS